MGECDCDACNSGWTVEFVESSIRAWRAEFRSQFGRDLPVLFKGRKMSDVKSFLYAQEPRFERGYKADDAFAFLLDDLENELGKDFRASKSVARASFIALGDKRTVASKALTKVGFSKQGDAQTFGTFEKHLFGKIGSVFAFVGYDSKGDGSTAVVLS